MAISGHLFRSQRTHAQNLMLVQWFQSGFWHRGNSNRVPDCVEHFDRVTTLAVGRRMMIDQFHDIAAPKAMLGNVAGKSGISVQLEAHDFYLSSIKVMNSVVPDNFSGIVEKLIGIP